MDWFEALTGFREASVADVRGQFIVEDDHLVSKANGRRMKVGQFETPSVAELRSILPPPSGVPTSVREVVGDVQRFHLMAANEGATFQVASQFNALEMVSPEVTPEDGVGRYEHDRTQGPACAIACGAGTIWRNYFTPVAGEPGQTMTRQIDTLADVGAALGVTFPMRNGYALPAPEMLRRAAAAVGELSADERRGVGDLLRIGMQWNTEVTLGGASHSLTQAYCSAAPIGYSHCTAEEWEAVARLILEGAYDATLASARVNAAETGNHTVFLTLLGGGVFANPFSWIADAIRAAVDSHADSGLDIVIVSYGGPDARLAPLLRG